MVALRQILFCLILMPATALAQDADSTATYPSSLGFENPDDTSSLLEYRLPDWSWYTWDAVVDLGGSGNSSEGYSSDQWDSELSTDYRRTHESERRQWSVLALFNGTWSRSKTEDEAPSTQRKVSQLRGWISLGGATTEYIVGDFGISIAARASGGYEEGILEDSGEPESRRIDQFSMQRLRPGSHMDASVTLTRCCVPSASANVS